MESQQPQVETGADNPTLARLEDQIRWYDRRSARSQRLFKWLKFVTIFSAAAIPILVAVDVSAYVAAVLGGVIAVSEGLQHVNQYQQNWIMYRSTAEALKHEKFLYLAGAAHYAAAETPSRCSRSGSRVSSRKNTLNGSRRARKSSRPSTECGRHPRIQPRWSSLARRC